jgi:hypothetical protein
VGFTYAQQIVEKKAKARPQTFEEVVPSQYHQFSKVFSEEASECLPEHRPGLDHPINLTGDAPAHMSAKVIPLSQQQQDWVCKEINNQLRRGLICPLTSPFAAPIFLIKKKDGSFQMIHDFRKLNNITVKNKYPLLLIEAILDQIQGAKYFTKLDVRWGYLSHPAILQRIFRITPHSS